VPIYDYLCSRCGHRVEVFHGIQGHGPKVCPSCGAEGTMGKAIVPPAIHFKGTGWAKKDRAATATPGKSRGASTATAAAPAEAGAKGESASSGSGAAAPASDGQSAPSAKGTSDASAGSGSD
jgi:putative FmdB family regulatory protein